MANSTDRKPNHLIIGGDGKLWSIDHGLTFHSDVKIRTVIWDFGGEPIPESLLDSLTEFQARLTGPKKSMPKRLRELLELLTPPEVEALKGRLDWVLDRARLPGAVAPQAAARAVSAPEGRGQGMAVESISAVTFGCHKHGLNR